MLKALFFLPVAAMIFLSTSSSQGQEGSPSANLDIIRNVAGSIGRELAGEMTGKRPYLVVLPAETAWYIEAGLREALKEAAVQLDSREMADVILEVGLRGSSVTYVNLRKRSFFGERIVDRIVKVSLTARGSRPSTGEVILSRDLESSFEDTISVSDIQRLENASLPITRGQLQDVSFPGGIVEPAVVIGALGVAIYLLFHVRS